MKKTINTLFKIALGLALFSSCKFISVNDKLLNIGLNSGKKVESEGKVETRTFEITDFDEISVSSFMNIHYEMTTGEPSLEIATYENIFDYLDIQCTEGKLNIKMKEGYRYGVDVMEIYVKSNTLSSMKLSGAGDIRIEEGLVTDEFEIAISGAGDIDIYGLKADKVTVSIAGAGEAYIDRLECDDIKVSIAGAGDICLKGKARNADFNIAGAGKIDASELKTENTNKRTSGIGSIIL